LRRHGKCHADQSDHPGQFHAVKAGEINDKTKLPLSGMPNLAQYEWKAGPD
jgi:hypothetical protein